jgi:hypothetical protein
MYIESLDLENIRTFGATARKPLVFVQPDCDFRPARTPLSTKDDRLPRPRLRNVTLLLGDNGSGKTNVLRAIAASAFGPAAKDLLRDSTMVRFDEDTAEIRASLRLHDQDGIRARRIRFNMRLHRLGERLETKFNSMSEALWGPVYESDNDAFFVVGYGATRRVERLDSYDPGSRARSRTARDLRVQGLFEDSFSLIPLASWLPVTKARKPGLYEQVEHLFNALLARSRYRFSGEQSKNGDYLFYSGKTPVPFQALSDGYRAFVGWVADLLYHACFTCSKGKKLVDHRGVVLVDEIDLHLHPKWQTHVVKTVARALPKMQFVFTSHSPLVAGSLEWMNIITLEVARGKGETIARRLKQGIHGLDADQILLTDFFGLSTTRATSRKRKLDELARRAGLGDDKAAHDLILAMSRGEELEL